ncbi:hypothetical protein INR49_007411 [Caranx melampygus]|nr:hypothetical protein INR49_007411 [Caranx melampygus]
MSSSPELFSNLIGWGNRENGRITCGRVDHMSPPLPLHPSSSSSLTRRRDVKRNVCVQSQRGRVVMATASSSSSSSSFSFFFLLILVLYGRPRQPYLGQLVRKQETVQILNELNTNGSNSSITSRRLLISARVLLREVAQRVASSLILNSEQQQFVRKKIPSSSVNVYISGSNETLRKHCVQCVKKHDVSSLLVLRRLNLPLTL